MARRHQVSPAPGNIAAALDELGISYATQDDEALFLCPYHHDTQVGSFSVNLETGQNFCFACGKGGSFTYMLTALRPDIDATRWVRGRVGYRIGQAEAVKKSDTTKQINEASLALFTDPPEKQLRQRHLELADVQALGIKWEETSRSWIIPIRSPDTGELWGWQSKGIERVRNHPRGIRKSLTLFGIDAVRGRRIIVVESPLDVARLRGAGFDCGVASYGVRISDEQLSLLAEHAEEVIWAWDNDKAGDDTCRELKPWKRARCRYYNYGDSDAKDPGEQTDEEIRWGVENATSALLTRW